MTLGQRHDKTLGPWKQLSKLLINLNIQVVSNGPEKDYSYVCILALSLGQSHDIP